MSIVLQQISKRYEDHPVVNRVSLAVNDGEFFVLLGPSGSGKSTILRIIAGLSSCNEGRVLLNGRDVTALAPQERGIGFVFQNYALFRYMTVAQNVQFGLKIRKVAAAEQRQRCERLLELVGLAGLGGRMPRQLSGGQQQRVALARALAYEPEVLLLDEPFGALDARVRADLRRTLKAIQRELGVTTIFVTHDQEEAFEMADRIGVMSAGRLLEVGAPEELYLRPQTEFVAGFLGTANLLVGQARDHGIRVGSLLFPHSSGMSAVGDGDRVQVLFRAEDVVLAPSSASLDSAVLGYGDVEQITFAGASERLRLRLTAVAGVRPLEPAVPFGSEYLLVDATRSQDLAERFPLQPGDKAWIGVRHVHVLNHPGMNFLIAPDMGLSGHPALQLGSQIAGLARARTTVLGYGGVRAAGETALRQASDRLKQLVPALSIGSATDTTPEAVLLELQRQPYDVVVLDREAAPGVRLAERVLEAGGANVLLAAGSGATPSRALICVAPGEPGKEEVRFAGRLLRHLGVSATLFAVLPAAADNTTARAAAIRFLAAGVATLKLLGVESELLVRFGPVRESILAELTAGGYDMLVLGAPLPGKVEGKLLDGLVGELISTATADALLIVQQPDMAPQTLRSRDETHIDPYKGVTA